jgi:hypothetical protein
MPLARYCFFVGGVLLALLFVSDAYLPKLPVADRTVADLPVIRIHSDRKWPERVVFDTRIPTVTRAQSMPIAAAPSVKAEAAAPAAVADVTAKARVGDAFAQLQLSDPKQLQVSDTKKPEPKLQRKRTIAKSRVGPPMMRVAQQPQFGFFANNTW